MGLILKPNLKHDKIEISVNEKWEESVDGMLNTWGNYYPLIKVNDYVVSPGLIKDFNVTVGPNTLPKFFITIDDSVFELRKQLRKQEIDIITIFIGNKNWYTKFTGIVFESPSETGKSEIFIYGNLYNTKLYNSVQNSYKDTSIVNVLKDICEKTDMGLFVYNNTLINQTLPYNINPNKNYLEYFQYNIDTYTNNLWSVDTNGIFYVSDVETLRKQKVDTFKYYGKVELEKELPIVITNYLPKGLDLSKNEKDKYNQFLVENITLSSKIGLQHISNTKEYFINGRKISSAEILGVGNRNMNTFEPFNSGIVGFHKNIVNKDIATKVIDVLVPYLIVEINPFSIIDLQLYLPKSEGIDIPLDKENSGKKIVLGYEYIFRPKTQLKQRIKLI